MIAAHVFAALGLAGLTLLPELFGDAFYGLLLAVIFYAVGDGLLEVCVSPIVEACPTKRKAAAMSLLHSFYCWGSVAVILASSLYFLFRGTGDWKVMALIWAAVPALNCIYFMLVPMPEQEAEAKSGSFKALFGNKIFWLMALLMICAGASEVCIAQWASSFAESGLGVSKVVGDIAGPCAFAFLMGVSRLVFAKLSEKVRLEPLLLVSGVLCAGGYLLIALSANAVVSPGGGGICGLGVGGVWPGVGDRRGGTGGRRRPVKGPGGGRRGGRLQVRRLPRRPGLGGKARSLTECGRQLSRRAWRLLQHQRFQRLEVPAAHMAGAAGERGVRGGHIAWACGGGGRGGEWGKGGGRGVMGARRGEGKNEMPAARSLARD